MNREEGKSDENRLLVLESVVDNILNKNHNILFGCLNYVYGEKEQKDYDLIFHSQEVESFKEVNIPEVVAVPVFYSPKKDDAIAGMYSLYKENPSTSLS